MTLDTETFEALKRTHAPGMVGRTAAVTPEAGQRVLARRIGRVRPDGATVESVMRKLPHLVCVRWVDGSGTSYLPPDRVTVIDSTEAPG